MLPVVLFVILAGTCSASLAYVILQPRIAREKKAAARLGQYSRIETDNISRQLSRNRIADTTRRRKSIQNSLKELDDRQKERSSYATRPSLRRRLEQAGLDMNERRFVIISATVGFVVFLVALLVSGSLLIAIAAAGAGGFGLPRITIDIMRKRRQKKFIQEFPNAIDLIVRGVKSGLPVNDTFRMIVSEAAEPVRSEFRKVVEAQQLGLPTAEAVERLFQGMPLSETNFFAIVIAIQSQAGGNLSDALQNLSKVLRERKKMAAKIQAMSAEAKASAGIIGALPIVVGGLLYLTTPDYVGLLFSTSIGNMLLLGCVAMMGTGIVVMRQMINFDF